MSDDEFLGALARCSLPEAEFGHGQHVRLAYLQLRQHDLYSAMRATRTLLSNFAASLGTPGARRDFVLPARASTP